MKNIPSPKANINETESQGRSREPCTYPLLKNQAGSQGRSRGPCTYMLLKNQAGSQGRSRRLYTYVLFKYQAGSQGTWQIKKALHLPAVKISG